MSIPYSNDALNEGVSNEEFKSFIQTAEDSSGDGDYGDECCDMSDISNWTEGRNKQRLSEPRTLRGNNQISKGVKDRTAQAHERFNNIRSNHRYLNRITLDAANLGALSDQEEAEGPPQMNVRPEMLKMTKTGTSAMPKRPLSPYIYFS